MINSEFCDPFCYTTRIYCPNLFSLIIQDKWAAVSFSWCSPWSAHGVCVCVCVCVFTRG